MLTLFSSFKPFRGPFGVIQRNAARSWARLEPPPEILLFDESEGTREIAAEIGARHLPRVRRNERGTALVSDIFGQAAERATSPTLCYVNGDILLGDDLTAAVARIELPDYLLVGRRTELEVDREMEFADGWRARLDRLAETRGRLQVPAAIDYFVFPRGLVARLEMPELAIGRPRWDNWLLYRARALGIPLVDLTEVVRVVHQRHDYSHIPGGIDGFRAQGRENLALAGGKPYLFTIRDATHRLTPRGLERKRDAPLSRRLDTFAALHPWSARPLRLLQRVRVAAGRLLSRSG